MTPHGRFGLSLVLFLLMGLSASALDVPALTGRVVDLAGLLTPQQTQALDKRLQQLEATDSTQVAVLTVPSLEGESLEDFTMRVVESWKLGQKGTDNGVLLFVALQDRAMRIEVGYGLEATLTDAMTSRIIRNEMTPRFRSGDYYGGIDAAVTGIVKTIQGVYQGTQPHASDADLSKLVPLFIPLLWILNFTGKWGGGIMGMIVGFLLPVMLMGPDVIRSLIGAVIGAILGFVLGAIIKSEPRSGRGDGPFIGTGGFGGGFGRGGFGGGGFGGFSGGGGGFGGGGSSGRW